MDLNNLQLVELVSKQHSIVVWNLTNASSEPPCNSLAGLELLLCLGVEMH
jgi:hypothetical protein